MAEQDGSGTLKHTTEARQGEERHTVRYVLLASLALAIFAMALTGVVLSRG